MKKFVLIMAFLLGLIVGYAQSTTLVPKTQVKTVQTEQTLTKSAVKTSMVYEGKPVYRSSRGNLFIVMVSKKTGQPYKKYLVSK